MPPEFDENGHRSTPPISSSSAGPHMRTHVRLECPGFTAAGPEGPAGAAGGAMFEDWPVTMHPSPRRVVDPPLPVIVDLSCLITNPDDQFRRDARLGAGWPALPRRHNTRCD